MARDRRVGGDTCGLGVADLTDEDHVGVDAQDRAQRDRERQARLGVDLDLLHAVEAVLDRVLDRHDALVTRADRRQITAYSVDVLPDPVGPVTKTAPCGAWNAAPSRRSSSAERPEARQVDDAARRVEQYGAPSPRRSRSGRSRRGRRRCGPAMVTENRPSCGRRFCAMSRPLSTLMRLINGRRTFSGASEVSCRIPSMRWRMMTLSGVGSMWRSDAVSFVAFSSSALTSLTIGPSSTRSNAAEPRLSTS